MKGVGAGSRDMAEKRCRETGSAYDFINTQLNLSRIKGVISNVIISIKDWYHAFDENNGHRYKLKEFPGK